MKEQVYSFCAKQMSKNPDQFVDSSNVIQATTLAEAFIDENNIDEKEEESVFDLVIDWLSRWTGRFKYNS